MKYYIEQISRWGIKNVENEITCFCMLHNISPKHILINMSTCGLHWVLEDLSSKIYLNKTKINNIIREKIQILSIFSEESITTFELIDRINKTNDVNRKIELWNRYFDVLSCVFSKLGESDQMESVLIPLSLQFEQDILYIN